MATDSLLRLLIFPITKQEKLHGFLYHNFFPTIDPTLLHCLENQISQEGPIKRVLKRDFNRQILVWSTLQSMYLVD